MRLEEVCSILVKVEQDIDVNAIKSDEICLWPLIRHCLWFSLTERNSSLIKKTAIKHNTIYRVGEMIVRVVNKILRLVRNCHNNYVIENKPTIVFFSRAVYLQRLSSLLLFDRIIDPLIFLSHKRIKVSKCYLLSDVENELLYYTANNIPAVEILKTKKINQSVRDDLFKIAQKVNLDPEVFLIKFNDAWSNFRRMYLTGIKIFFKNKNIKRIYVTSWYFPDMMGLIAAAKIYGVETIDVQHGKQGKYQGMYSWWTKIPDVGYQLMPDSFWCWGRQSCNHILQSNNKNNSHNPFLGGYPWLDFYKKFIASVNKQSAVVEKETVYKKRILLTLQPPQGEHAEPIPSFILDFLNSDKSNLVQITFRCHPNFHNCQDYCVVRLKNIPENKYKISLGESNLYDDFLESTHHITAYSSCCYEADAFGVPTLLFGLDALAIYSEEIRKHVFTWTKGDVKDVSSWLEKDYAATQSNNVYIESSLDIAEKALFPAKS